MSGPVYVVAVFNEAHGVWAEFVVTPSADVASGVSRVLVSHVMAHLRVVKVARDDWSLIEPALAALAVPPPCYTAKEYQLYCRSSLEAAAAIDADFSLDKPLPRGGVVLGLDVRAGRSFERRRRVH